MANVYAVKSGNWSDTTVWNTGALPTSADDVYANNYTVTIDTSPTVLSIRNTAASPIVAGGIFVPTNGITLTCTGAGIVAGTTFEPCFESSLTSGQSCNLVANLTGGTNNNTHGARNSGAGTINITGNCTTLSGRDSAGASNNSTGTINITGDCTGGINRSDARGAWNASIGTLNITGKCTTGTSGVAAQNKTTGTMTVIGTIEAGNTVAIDGTALNQNTFLTGPFIGTAQGIPANVAYRWRWIPSVGASYMTAVNSDATGYKNLYTADSTDSNSGQPAASNVRSGTVYGPSSELTGTCAVPAAGSVAFGVPVDATTGTAVLTPESVRSAVGLASANLDSQLSRVANAATTQEVADIVEGAVSA